MPSKGWKYDVFLSFRGVDTRRTFVSYLHYCLELKGIRTFKDDNWLVSGKSIPDELLKAIEDSKFAVVIFSKYYASSKWCLEELVHIMKCRNELGQIVIPIFYDVCPSDVQHQRGSFADSFVKHEEKCRNGEENMEKIERWRDVLAEAAVIPGLISRNFMDDVACIKELINWMFPKSWKYDVYLSFRREDIGNTFVSYLNDALEQNGIHTFIDDGRECIKMEISEESVKTIQESRFAIVIFSKGYAASEWCLEELAHIIRCKKELGQIVIPIFYDVSPHEIGYQYSSFGESFSQHKQRCKDDDDDREKIQRWWDASMVARKIQGHCLENYKDEADCIKKVVDFISPKSFKLLPFKKA